MLSLNRTAFSRDDIVTGQIETLLYAFGGAFELKTPENLKATELVRSSPNSMLVDTMNATKSGEEATRSFNLRAIPCRSPCGLRASSRPHSRRA